MALKMVFRIFCHPVSQCESLDLDFGAKSSSISLMCLTLLPRVLACTTTINHFLSFYIGGLPLDSHSVYRFSHQLVTVTYIYCADTDVGGTISFKIHGQLTSPRGTFIKLHRSWRHSWFTWHGWGSRASYYGCQRGGGREGQCLSGGQCPTEV